MLEKILPVVLFVILSSDKKVGAVCTSLQNHVLDCYKENRHTSLKCSQLVQAYMDCVEQARKVDTYYGSNHFTDLNITLLSAIFVISVFVWLLLIFVSFRLVRTNKR